MVLFLIYINYIIFYFNTLNYYVLFWGALFFMLYLFLIHYYFIKSKKINQDNTIKDFEIRSSMITLFWYFLFISVLFYLSKYLKLNFSFNFGWTTIIAFVMYIFYHDIYFYFSHRLIHINAIFKFLHLEHHKSKFPNVMSTYNFSIKELIIHVWVIIPIFFFDANIYALFWAILVYDTGNIIWHSWYEFFEWKEITKSKIFTFISLASYHDLHHTHNNWNYALYFSYLDRIFGTYDSKYDLFLSWVKNKNINDDKNYKKFR